MVSSATEFIYRADSLAVGTARPEPIRGGCQPGGASHASCHVISSLVSLISLPQVRLPQAGELALEDEIRAFVAEAYGRVVSAVGLVTGSSDGAEDAVQDALLKVVRDGHRPDNLAAWVTVVATNQVRQAQRRRRTEDRVVERIPRHVGDAEASLAEAVDIRAAIADLPQRQREVVLLYYYLDVAVADIAESMRISTGTVKTQLHRARATLASILTLEGSV